MTRINDETHGPVAVTVESDRVRVSLDSATASATAELHRFPEAAVRADVPIGTRDPAFLGITVDGLLGRIAPGRGRYSRKSYVVDVWIEGVHYRLDPSEQHGSVLLRDGVEKGFFASDGPAAWLPGVEARDGVVGYLLASGFGVGGRGLLASVLSVASKPVVGVQYPGRPT